MNTQDYQPIETQPYPRYMRMSQIPDSWILESNSQDVAATVEYLTPAARAIVEDESIGALFIEIDSSGADFAAIYGITGSVAYTWKTAIRLQPLELEQDEDYPIELRRDGSILEQFKDVDSALRYLHMVEPSSYSHAIRHEGYAITRLGILLDIK